MTIKNQKEKPIKKLAVETINWRREEHQYHEPKPFVTSVVKLLFPRALLLQCGGFTEHLSTYYEKVTSNGQEGKDCQAK
jgi:hypothetical protein